MSHQLTLYFDGGCQPNPGPIETAVVVCGVVHLQHGIAVGDNNEAEWLSLRNATALADAAGARDVLFVGDSAVVIGQAADRTKCRSPQLRAHYIAFKTAITGFVRVRYKLVPRSKNLAGIALARRHDFARPPG